MSRLRTAILTSISMIAFAGNSLLCRVALKQTRIDPISFTNIRLAAGALTLWSLVALAHRSKFGNGNWLSALALVAYAACFSYAYVALSAGTGALLLFGAVQATMIGYGLAKGERLQGSQTVGLVLAVGGLVCLLLPGLSAPPLFHSLLMAGAGAAWGVYSIRGKGQGDPTCVNAGNFLRAVPMAVVIGLLAFGRLTLDPAGVGYAIASGALASGLGYACWYAALRGLTATTAAAVQLGVPVMAALGGILFLGEALTLRLALTSTAILSGIALVVLARRR